mmetsp:Transcript_44285/g.102266  ORF Transcript_44285/g.102266 Transcript_44285/m.102266 type:complete len:408 (+) Transcript_44285:70-1293(+)
MGEGLRKKRRLVKSRRVAAPAGEEAEADAKAAGGGESEAEEATGGEAEAGSVAQVLSQAIAGSTDAEEADAASELEKQFGRLFGGSNSVPAINLEVRKKKRAKEEPGKPEDKDAVTTHRVRTPEERLERESRMVFVGNVPLQWDERDLRKVMKSACGDTYTGKIAPIWFRSEPLEMKWRHRNNFRDGHILKDYAHGVSDAKNAYALLLWPEAVPIVCKAVHGLQADETHILRADGVGAAAKLLTFDRKKSVFVGNLPSWASEAELRRVMSKVGDVHAVRIIRDKEAKACKGFAFVRFAERKSAKAALSLWGMEVQGRCIRVMKVEDQNAEEKEKARCAREDELHPAAKRCLMNMQRRQRARVRKAQYHKKEAIKEGRTPGSKRKSRAERKRKLEGKFPKVKGRRKGK